MPDVGRPAGWRPQRGERFPRKVGEGGEDRLDPDGEQSGVAAGGVRVALLSAPEHPVLGPVGRGTPAGG